MTCVPTREQSEERLAAVQAQIARRLTDETLARWWNGRVASTPDHTAVQTDTCTRTYRELDLLARRVARCAQAMGVRPADVVGIQLPASVAFLVLILGLAKLGARLSLLGTALRGRSLRHALREVPSRLVFTTPAGREAFAALGDGDLPELVAVDVAPDPGDAPSDSGLAALEDWLARAPGASDSPLAPPSQSPDETLFYIFTSGTTGLPKATQCSHRRYLAGATSESILLEMSDADCMYVVLPMFHIAALSAIGAALSVSASVVIRPRFSASRFWRDVRAFSATTFQYLGEILRYLLAQPARDDDRPNSMRAMLGAGITTKVWREFEERFGPVRIVESYGSSEGVIGIFNLDEVAGSVGRPPRVVEERLRIVDYDLATDALVRGADGRLLVSGEGAAGELIARLDDRSQFEGYSSAAATQAKLIEGAFEDGDLWYRSGDLFRQQDGYFFFVSRLGDSYRWKGENVSTQQVAEVFLGCDDVEHAVIYGVNVPDHEGSAGMALIAMKAGRAFDGRRLHERLTRELPSHALPLFVRIGDGRAVLTDTYKLGTAELKKQGYAAGLVDDPLYVLDAGAACYVPLDDDSLERAGLPHFEDATNPNPGREASDG